MINVLVVEDDELQRKNLVDMLKELGEEYHIFEASTHKDVLRIVDAYSIDLFYFDVHLPEISGLEIAASIRQNPKYELAWIVFITTHVEYIMEAFKKLHCYDYIMKPFSKEKIQELTRILTKGGTKKELLTEDKKPYILFNIKGISIKIFIDQMIFIEACRRNSIIHTTTGKYEVKKLPLKNFLSMIDTPTIFQTHRSFIINMDFVNSIDKNRTPWEIVFENYEQRAFVGGKFKTTLLEKLQSY